MAVTSRQSAIAWLALPAWMAVREYLCRRNEAERRWRLVLPEIVTVVAGLGVYLATGWAMNETYAQRVMTGAMWSSLDPVQFVRGTGFAVVVFCLAAGCGAFFRRCLAARNTVDEGLRLRPMAVAVGVGVFVAAWSSSHLLVVEFEVPLREMMGSCRYAVWVASMGWALGGWRVRWECVATGCVAAALVGLRGSVWDYYLLDVGVLGYFALERCHDLDAGVRVPWGRWAGLACGCAVGAVALVQHSGTAMRVKRVMDGSRALVVLCERALRAGRIDADELSIAPFGLQVWHLYPRFIRTVGSDGQYIAGFTRFLRPGALGMEVTGASAGSIDPVIVPGEGEVVATGVFRAMWREQHRFTLRPGEDVGRAELPWDVSGTKVRPFPLNDDEWNELVSGPRLE